MLPTFVIGLREGLEAALIVGIVAAFLRRQGRRDLLRWVFVGVASSVVLCLAVGLVLRAASQNLPQRQQEGLETVIGAVAVGMVTYMVVWMRRHSRELKGQLEGAAADALANGSGWALVAMAFLAVLREGFETVVFLLAAFNESGSGSAAGLGALLGIVVAVALGYGVYRGGVRINLSRFFRATGVVLVLVAAGLVVNALHTAHEAGWLDIGQQRTVDLSAVVRPGSVQASLLTGMLGVQDHPVLIEVIGWLAYLLPVGLYVGWPPGRKVAHAILARIALVAGAAAGVAGLVLALVVPGRPQTNPVTRAGAISAGLVSRNGDEAVVRVSAPTGLVTARRGEAVSHDGVPTEVYTAVRTVDAAAGRPGAISYAELAERNGGRLPLGVHPTDRDVPVSYAERTETTFWVEPRTGRVVDVALRDTVTMTARVAGAATALGPVADSTTRLPPAAVQAATQAAHRDVTTLDRRRLLGAVAASVGVLAVALLLVGALYLLAARRYGGPAPSVPTRSPELVSS
jgi:high-affinity iron transporter